MIIGQATEQQTTRSQVLLLTAPDGGGNSGLESRKLSEVLLQTGIGQDLNPGPRDPDPRPITTALSSSCFSKPDEETEAQRWEVIHSTPHR